MCSLAGPSTSSLNLNSTQACYKPPLSLGFHYLYCLPADSTCCSFWKWLRELQGVFHLTLPSGKHPRVSKRDIFILSSFGKIGTGTPGRLNLDCQMLNNRCGE